MQSPSRLDESSLGPAIPRDHIMASNAGSTNPRHSSRRGIAFRVALLAAFLVGIVLFIATNDRRVAPAPAEMPNRKALGQSLLTAIRDGKHATVRALLDQGAEVNARNGLRDTALMQAALNSDRTMMQLLLQGGADVHARGVYDVTALFRAVRSEQGKAAASPRRPHR